MKRLAAACLLWAGVAQAADVRLKLAAPGQLVGDGRALVLTLTVDPPADLGPLTLDADAGQVGATRQPLPGTYEIDFTPPRVAVTQDVHVSAVVGGARTAPTVMRVLPAPLTAREMASGGALDLRGPSRVLLGGDAPVTLSLKKTARPPALAVNVGSLGPAEARGDRWLVRWTPPRERFPQVAVIGAVAADGASDWLAIPLYGVGRIETRTKPAARLVVRVGDVDFGPFRADAAGNVMTSVIAPPGIATARGHAVDRLGNEKDASIDLGIPPFSRVLALCGPRVVDLFVVDAGGAPADAQRLGAAAAGAPLQLNRVGLGHLRAPVPASDQPVEVRALLDDKLAARCTVAPAPVQPSALRVTIDQARWRAGDPPVGVTVQLGFADAGAHASRKITLRPEVGTVTDLVPTPDGVHARWRPPDQLRGRASAKIEAHLEEPSLRAEAVLALGSGPPARLAVEAPGAVTADGRATARVRVRAEDAFGNPARLSAPRAADGDSALRGIDAGVATFDWRPPARTRSGDAELAVRDDTGAAGSVRVRLRAPRHAFGLGLEVGYLTNFGRVSAPLVTLDFAYRLPWLGRNLSIGLTSGFYLATYSVAATEPVDVRVTAVPLLARVDYQIPLGPAALFAGVGGGALLPVVAAKSTSASLSSTEVAGAFAARIGADVDVRVGRVVAELGYWYAPVASGDLIGNFGGLSVLAGWRLEL